MKSNSLGKQPTHISFSVKKWEAVNEEDTLIP